MTTILRILEDKIVAHLGQKELDKWKAEEKEWVKQVVDHRKYPDMANPYKFEQEKQNGESQLFN